MADSPRIAELRRRLLDDPGSIAFAQLADEHRRAGEYDEAIRLCRAGLAQHPGYLSARVTLGRALIEVGDLHGAMSELEQVLCLAPDNLAATQALHDAALRRSASLADGEPWHIATLEVFEPALRNLSDPLAHDANAGDSDEDGARRPLNERSAVDTDVHHSNANHPNENDSNENDSNYSNDPNDRVLLELESWLSAIVAARRRRREDTRG